MTETPLSVGVVGIGAMGRHHARVYKELLDASLVGISDIDAERAAEVASEYGTDAMTRDGLLEAVDAVSIAVPTPYHYEVARAAIDRGVSVLVEKPFVEEAPRGRELIDRARDQGVALQVGHIERFNPAIRVLGDVVADQSIIAVNARRLGPPPDREIPDSSVMDLMIHDIDILLSLVGSDVTTVEAVRAHDTPWVTAIMRFDNGVSGSLSASRVTQQKVRKLGVTTSECQINVDYIAQSITIHRRSMPEYIVSDGAVRYRHESVIERPTVSNDEPLRAELQSFITSARSGSTPVVTGADGLRAIELAELVEKRASRTNEPLSLRE